MGTSLEEITEAGGEAPGQSEQRPAHTQGVPWGRRRCAEGAEVRGLGAGNGASGKSTVLGRTLM